MGTLTPPISPPTPKFGDPNAVSDVASAWLELTLLCQCYGQYQEGSVYCMLNANLHHCYVLVHYTCTCKCERALQSLDNDTDSAGVTAL